MSYEPTNWKTGDVVTSAKLNKLENAVAQSGGGNGNLVVHVTKTTDNNNTTKTLDKTWKEIHDVFMAGGNIVSIIATANNTATIYSRTHISTVVSSEDGGYSEYVVSFEDKPTEAYIADNENGYPAFIAQK